MFELIGIAPQALFGQLLLGLINGSFYAMLSIGLAVIFGLLNIINFAHGAQYMMGAFAAWMLLNYLGVNYWGALILGPLIVGTAGVVIERFLLSRVYKLDHLYGLLITFGLALVIQGLFRIQYGVSGLPYGIPPALSGGLNLGFMFLPTYRAWVILASVLVCVGTWLIIERTKLGSYLRAATENPALVSAFGVNVPLLITLTYGFGVALAAFAGVLAAPIYAVNPMMGAEIVIVVFAVVVIGGMGSIVGSIVTGFGLGLIEALTRLFYPAASATVIFLIMAIVLMIRPAGLFGGPVASNAGTTESEPANSLARSRSRDRVIIAVMCVLLLAAPAVLYPVFLSKVLCFALFACAFNLLLGYGGLLSFGHAAYFGVASYVCAYAAKTWELNPEGAIILGTAAAAGLGFIFGSLAIRRQGIYFAMVTLALAQMVYFFALESPNFTGGEDGLQGVPRGKLFGVFSLESDHVLYYFVATVFVLGFVFMYRVINSPFGQVLVAIRDNESRAVSLGYHANRYKLIVFVLSSAMAGLAGATKAIVFQFASLADVHWATSGEVVLMTLVGGLNSVFGPVIGALVVVTMDSYLAALGGWIAVVQGLIFVACVLLFRNGIVGLFAGRSLGTKARTGRRPEA